MITRFALILKKLIPTSNYECLKRIFYSFFDTPTHSYFNTRTIFAGHQKVTYKGVQAIRCPFDYVIYQMIITDIKPDLIIEVGTHQGGGALYLADLMDILDKGVIHTIDIEKNADASLYNHPRIKVFTDGWENYNLDEAKGFQKILVIEDGAHTYDCSIGAIKKLSHLVSVGSYLVVEDGILSDLGMDKEFNGGPLKAINEFISKNDDFIIDRKWCDLFGKNATFNVNGYLKRIK